ncbi:MAG: glycosyltransferase family 4 protein [Pseudomonadota bacterium]
MGALPWTRRATRLTHFIYGEDTYLFTPLWKNGRNRCLATYHYPPDRLIERVNPGVLKSLDAVVAVGINQVDYFSRFLPADRIHYLPHPVDADFFSPGPPPPVDPIKLLCVGQMYRRHDEVLAVHRRLCNQGYALETHVIGPKTLLEHPINREPGIQVHVGLSDDALLEHYRTASIGLLPLSDATANNSLLEMMACGLPVVSTHVGGVGEYAQGSAVRLTAAGDIDGLCAHVEQLMHAPEVRLEEGRRNRQHVLQHLSLPVAAQRMFDLYEKVLTG